MAETISCSDSFDVFLLTKKDKDFLPLSISSSRSKATSFADRSKILTEKVVDSSKDAVIKNNIKLNDEKIKIIVNNKTKIIINEMVIKTPDIMSMYFESWKNKFFILSINLPIHTTGWIGEGNSPNNKSMQNDAKIMIKIIFSMINHN